MSSYLLLVCSTALFFYLSGCFFVYGFLCKCRTSGTKRHRPKKGVYTNPLTHDKSSATKSIKTSSFDSILDLTKKSDLITGAVISDELGLPIASSIAKSDELAISSVLFSDSEKKLTNSVNFGKLIKIEFTNSSMQNLTVMPITVNDQIVYFSGLSNGPVNYSEVLPDHFEKQ